MFDKSNLNRISCVEKSELKKKNKLAVQTLTKEANSRHLFQKDLNPPN